MDNEIKEEFYKAENGFRPENVYRALIAKGDKYKNLTLKQVKAVLNTQEVVQRFRRRTQAHQTFFPIQAKGRGIWSRAQMDLLDMQASDNSQQNEGYKWIFNLIFVSSRFMFCIPMKTKGLQSCSAAMKQCLEDIRKLEPKFGSQSEPCQIDCDNEKAFVSPSFQAFCKDNFISLNFVRPGDVRNKGIVERSNGTLRNLMERYKLAYKTQNWSQALGLLVHSYNQSIHSILGPRNVKHGISPAQIVQNNEPSEYYLRKVREQILKAQKSTNFQIKHLFRVGDKVRIMLRRDKTIFDKQSGPSFSKSIHTIEQVINSNAYKVSDRRNTYKKDELVPYSSSEERPPNIEEKYAPYEGEEEEPAEVTSSEQYRALKAQQRRLAKEGVKEANVQSQTTEAKSNRALRRKKPDYGAMIQFEDNQNDFT